MPFFENGSFLSLIIGRSSLVLGEEGVFITVALCREGIYFLQYGLSLRLFGELLGKGLMGGRALRATKDRNMARCWDE